MISRRGLLLATSGLILPGRLQAQVGQVAIVNGPPSGGGGGTGVQAGRMRDFTTYTAIETQLKYTEDSSANPYYFGSDTTGAAVRTMLDFFQPGGLNSGGTKGTYVSGSPIRGSGLNCVRETNLNDDGGLIESVCETWGGLGIKFILGYFYPGSPYGGDSGSGARSEQGFIAYMISQGYVAIAEGPNEVDNFGPYLTSGSYTSPSGGCATTAVTGARAAAAMAYDTYTFFHTSAKIAFASFAAQTYSSSNAVATALSSNYGKAPNQVADYANAHAYAVGGYNMGDPGSSVNGYGDLDEQITNNVGFETGMSGKIVTETGFVQGNFDGGASAGSYGGKYGNNYVNGCYLPQLYLHGFNYGLVKLTYYELADDHPDDGTIETHFGAFFYNKTPKGCAVTLNAMLQVISDTGSTAATFAPGKLNYTLSGMPANGESCLLQRADGMFVICLWSNASIYVGGTYTAATVSNVTITFGTAPAHVYVYDPNWPGVASPTSTPNYSGTCLSENYSIVGSTSYAANMPQMQPIQAWAGAGSITVAVGDGAIFVVVKP
jgi:hypothetical protein